MSDPVESYLAQLQSEATTDSRGVFSVDLGRGLEKIGRFQLQSPHHAVLALVSCAVGLEGQRVEFFGQTEDRIFELSGAGFGHPEMQRLFSAALAGESLEGRRRALRNLALALQSSVSGPDLILSGTTSDGESGAKISIQGGQLTISPAPPANPHLNLHFRRPRPKLQWLSNTARRWMGLPLPSTPDRQLMQRHCRFCQVPLRWENQDFNLAQQGRWEHLMVINPSRIRVPLKPLRVRQESRLEQDLPYFGYLGRAGEGGGLALIVDGVLCQHHFDPPDDRFRAILWHNGLRRDLSLETVVADESLGKFFEEISSLYRGLP